MIRMLLPDAVQMIASFEGFQQTAYKDAAGTWTIGYGHTGAVHSGDVTTQAQAAIMLQMDLQQTAAAVSSMTDDVTTSDHEYGALVSLAYNIGVGAFRGSSVLKYHRAGKQALAAGAFLLWDQAHVDGRLQPVKGLLARREAEAGYYLSKDT